MDPHQLTDAEILAQKTQLANEERRRKLTSKDHRTEILADLEAASKAVDSVSTAYQYGGPTMQGMTHSDLAQVLSRLVVHVYDLLWLNEDRGG